MKTTSLKLSKRIRELGMELKTENYWVGDSLWDATAQSELETNNTPSRDRWIPAPTVDELGEVFNELGVDLFVKAYGEVFDFKGTQGIGLLGVMNLMRNPDMSAKMVIYLKEQNLI